MMINPSDSSESPIVPAALNCGFTLRREFRIPRARQREQEAELEKAHGFMANGEENGEVLLSYSFPTGLILE